MLSCPYGEENWEVIRPIVQHLYEVMRAMEGNLNQPVDCGWVPNQMTSGGSVYTLCLLGHHGMVPPTVAMDQVSQLLYHHGAENVGECFFEVFPWVIALRYCIKTMRLDIQFYPSHIPK